MPQPDDDFRPNLIIVKNNPIPVAKEYAKRNDRMAVPCFFQLVTRALRTANALRGMAPVAQGWA